MFKLAFALFILVPLAELYLLIEVGSGIGGLATITLCLLTAALGGILVRHQGMRTLLQAKKLMEQGQPPAEQMVHGIMIAISGVLLFLPGFITDIIGFVLLIPIVRMLLGRWLVTKQLQQTKQRSVVIEAEIIHPENSSDKPKLP